MKQSIHPKYFDAQVTCTCGNSFSVGSTHEELRVEICSRCHPFFTGEMKFTTAKGKVEKFQERRKVAKQVAATKSQKEKKQQTASNQPKTLKEMLLGLQ